MKYKDLVMCSMSAYSIEIVRKADCSDSLERFEFFFSSCVTRSSDKLILHCVGADLSDMLRKIEDIISDIAYVSSVHILGDIVIFDKYDPR